MDKGFGIAALVVAIVAIIVPFPYTIHSSGLAIVLAVIAGLAGDRVFATAVPIIAAVNTFWLSPLLWLALQNMPQGNTGGFYVVVFAALAAPFVAMALNASGTIVLGDKPKG